MGLCTCKQPSFQGLDIFEPALAFVWFMYIYVVVPEQPLSSSLVLRPIPMFHVA